MLRSGNITLTELRNENSSLHTLDEHQSISDSNIFVFLSSFNDNFLYWKLKELLKCSDFSYAVLLPHFDTKLPYTIPIVFRVNYWIACCGCCLLAMWTVDPSSLRLAGMPALSCSYYSSTAKQQPSVIMLLVPSELSEHQQLQIDDNVNSNLLSIRQ